PRHRAISSISLHYALPIFRAVIALNLRKPPERQQRDQGRQPTEAMDEIDLRAMRPQRRARLPELRRARRETEVGRRPVRDQAPRDRKSTRLNSSHQIISYA